MLWLRKCKCRGKRFCPLATGNYTDSNLWSDHSGELKPVAAGKEHTIPGAGGEQTVYTDYLYDASFNSADYISFWTQATGVVVTHRYSLPSNL